MKTNEFLLTRDAKFQTCRDAALVKYTTDNPTASTEIQIVYPKKMIITRYYWPII